MITGFERRHHAAPFAIGLSVLGMLAAPGFAMAAEEASRWDGDARSAVRLVAGSSSAGGTTPLLAGIEIRIKDGWHTYWRYPGDAGVPPRFDFAGSQNLKSVAVSWPAPQRIPEQGLVAIGYVRSVTWPLTVVPQDPAKPVTLRLKLDYAVCERLCVPAEAMAELVLGGSASHPAQDAALAEAQTRVPKKRALGDGRALAVKAVRREDVPAPPHVIVDVAAPPGAAVALFAEGPTADWALPVPRAIEGAPAGLQRFVFDLDGAPPGAKYEGAAITLTAVAGDDAIEVAARLD